MSKFLILAVAILVTSPLHAAEHDMEWFVKNPKQRAAWLQKCQANQRVSHQICENARQADLHSYVDESTAKLDRGTSQPAPGPIPTR